MNKVKVELGERSYDVLVGEGFLSEAPQLLEPLLPSRHIVIITDENVARLYGSPLRESFLESGWKAGLAVVTAGDETKSLQSLEKLCEILVEEGLDRTGTVVALGGGMVSDLAGFTSAVYMRGVSLVQIPTSLLAQVDSSIGGKVAVNLIKGKNLVGAFYQPNAVLADIALLDTLPDGEFASGLAEVIKYGLIRDASIFESLEKSELPEVRKNRELIHNLVLRSIKIKAQVVSEDEREKGLRAILNLGHTFAHAFETHSEYRIGHGEAVAVGLLCASLLAERTALAREPLSSRVSKILPRYQLPNSLAPYKGKVSFSLDELIEIMHRDKKKSGQRIRFVLPARIGQVVVTDEIDERDLRVVLDSVLPAG